MKIKAYLSGTIFDATKAMIKAIDHSDFAKEHIVVVPDRFSLQMEKLLLETLGSSLFNVRVLGLTSLATDIFARLNQKVDVLSSGECLLLTQKAIENVKKDFKTFRKSGINFCYEINKILSQIKSAGLGPDMLNEEAEGLTGGKYHDIKLIYKEYQSLLEGRLDANGRLALLNETIKNSDLLANTSFYFAQFDSFTKEGYQLIKVLLTSSREVNVSLARPLSIGNDYIYEKDIMQKLSHLAKECGCEVEVIETKDNFSPHKEAIVKGLYSYQNVTCENHGFYSVYSSQNIYDEVLSTAKAIYYFVQRGYSYKDIVVATGELDKYQNMIESVFDRFDLPFFIDSSVTADKTILANLVVDFFETVAFSYPNDHLLSLASNALLGQEELVDNLQKYNVDGKAKYKKYIAKDFAYDDILQQLEKSKTAQDYQKVIQNICDRVRENFDKVEKTLEEKALLKERDINRQAEEILLAAADLINKYSNEVSINEYLKMLKLLLSFKEVSTVPTYVDGVMVGDASSSYFGDCKILIVLGGQSLPIVSSDNGLLNDKDLSLNFVDKKIEPTIRMINRRNRFKLFGLLSQPTDRLLVFCRALNDEGKKNEMPAYVDSLNKIFSQNVLRTQEVFYNNGQSEGNSFLVKLGNRKNFLSENIDKLSKENINEYLSQDHPYKKLDKESTNISQGRRVFFDNNRVSASQLEQYFSCPFKHFVSYGLRLKEKDTSELDARDSGNICHAGAELLVKELIEGKAPESIDISTFIETNFDKILNNAGLNEKISNANEQKSLVSFFKHQLATMFKDILTELGSSCFKPTHVEYRLTNMEIAGLNFSGKLDRLDECGDYFRIIDYKTGKTGNILKELYYGEKLQLFLYQRIAKQMLNKESAGIFYFNARYDYAKTDEDKVLLKGLVENNEEIIKLFDKNMSASSKILSIYKAKDGSFKGSALAKEDLSVYEDYAFKVAEMAISEMSEGYLQPKPNEDSCLLCKYKSICRYEKVSGQRKQYKVENFKEYLKDEE